MRLVILSDTHGRHESIDVPDGDLLIHCGDFCSRGTLQEVADFAAWFEARPHRHKILIAGNHDWPFERSPSQARALLGEVHYLQDSGVRIDGLHFYGSPWQPRFFNWAFNLDRGAALAEKWASIPADCDVLLTHGPPYGVADWVPRGEHAGCEELTKAVARVRPRLHAFGHIHEGYGREERDGTLFVNACNCNERYEPINPPQVVDLP